MNELVLEWVNKAEGDFMLARLGLKAKNSLVFDGVCFHCQQTVEKYLKAMLVEHKIEFHPRHDLLYLYDLLITVEPSLEFIRKELHSLTMYAVDIRYPGDIADEEEAKQAYSRMQVVRNDIRQKLGLTKNRKRNNR